MQQIFAHYAGTGEQQRTQAFERLKEEFSIKVQQALQQQMGSKASTMHIDIEKQPQFLEEWRKLKAQLDSQYVQVLGELKTQLEQIS
jgi:alpha-glucuronidase